MKTIITPAYSFRKTLSDCFAKKDLLILLTKREIYLRYKYKTLGLFWGVLQPLLLAGVISASLGKVASPAIPTQYYFLSVFVGYTFWTYFSSTIGKQSGSIVANRILIKNTAFPHILLPLSTLGVGCIDFSTCLLLAIAIGLFGGLSVQVLPILFLCIVIMLITTVAIGLLFAAIYTRFTDAREMLSFLITILFFLTPVIYPVRLIPSQFHSFLYLNPMTGVIETARAALLGPSATPWSGLLISSITSVVLLILGIFIFEKIDRGISDTI